MASKFFYDTIKPSILEWFDDYELTFLDEDYERYTDQINVEDKDGYRYSLKWQTAKILHETNGELKIGGLNKHKGYNIKLWMSRNTPQFVFLKVKSGLVYFICDKGHHTKRTWHDLNTRNTCPDCNQKRYIDMDIIAEEFSQKGYIVNKDMTEFKGNVTTVIFDCDVCGSNNVRMTYRHYKKGGICKCCKSKEHCKNIKWYDKKDAIDLILKNNWDIQIKCDDKINNSSEIKCTCFSHDEPHSWTTNWRVFRRSKYGCIKCFTSANTGENNSSWRGGISLENGLYLYLRMQLCDWKKETMKNCGFKCRFTNERFDDIHHIHSFGTIVQETFLRMGMEIDHNITKYEKGVFDDIKMLFMEIHDSYGLGVCLTKEVHKLFHKIYKYGNNTEEQWIEFERDFKSGKYIKGIDY